MYGVMYVADDQLPTEQDWALTQTVEGDTYFFIKESAASAAVIAEGWAAYRQLEGPRTVCPRLSRALRSAS